MNIISLGKTIVQNYFFMKALTHKLGEPVHFSEEASQKVLEDLKKDIIMRQKFAVVVDVKTQKILWHLNTEKLLKYKGELTTDKFFLLIHADFLVDFIKWAQASYIFIFQNRHLVDPLNQSSRLTIPLKMHDNKYHWVLQEVMPFQVDASNYVVTHLNIYTPLHPVEDGEKLKVNGRLFNNGFEMKEWTQTVWKDFFTHRPFELTPEHQKIAHILNENLELSNTAIAEILNKQKNTIDVQNKQILMRARESFPNHTFVHIKDVVRFLREIDYFNNGNMKDE
jgi:hypothetical protein